MKTRILVVEDTVSIREEISTILGFEGYEILTASHGVAGVEIAKASLPDLILSDIMMPEMDGWGLLKTLRQSPETAGIPFLFLTARASQDDLRHGMDLGADDYLAKPFTAPDLVRAVKTRLEKRAAIVRSTEKVIHGRFVEVLPHEFRTALNGILGFGRLIEAEGSTMPPEDLKTMANEVVTSGERLERTLQNFLLYSKFEAELGLPDRKCAPSESCDPSICLPLMLKRNAERELRSGDLQIDLDSFLLPIAQADLVKMVEELADNAFKFSTPGTSVHVVGRSSSHQYHIEVSDHGRGMTRDQIESVAACRQFDRERYEQQGCGLGLFLAGQIAKLYQAEFSLKSTGGRGTTARIELPLSVVHF